MEKGEEEMVSVMKIGRETNFDLVVKLGRDVMMQDGRGGGSDEDAIVERRRVVEGGTRPTVDAAQRQRVRFVGIAHLARDGQVTRARKVFLAIVLEFARVDVDMVAVRRIRTDRLGQRRR